LEVLLVSVDKSYGKDPQTIVNNIKRTLRKRNVDWPCVVEPTGWTGIVRRYNCDGYGLALVDSDGIVRGMHLRVEDVDRLLAAAQPTQKPTPGR
jgi:hypothetical protein